MVSIQHNNLTIQVFDDTAFNETPDSLLRYDHIYHASSNKGYQPVSQHGIIVLKNGVKISSAILLATAGATSVTKDAVIVNEDYIITRCCNTVFSLSLPELQLNWMTEVDWATCFSIHTYEDTYITHGEISISRINKEGKILWQFEGADIFVCLNKDAPFIMQSDYILLTDFNRVKYKIGYDGKEMPLHLTKDKSQVVKKPWWRFWQV
jgi:hypothetical protein